MRVFASWKFVLAACVAAVLAVPAGSAYCAEKKDEKKKDKKGEKDAPKEPRHMTAEELLAPTEKQLVSDAIKAQISADVADEWATRAVPIPGQVDLALDWYTPRVNAEVTGVFTKAWVVEDLILVETDKNNLIAIQRDSGVVKWVCVLEDAVRYQPAVSRNNVVVNVKNFLVGIHKEGGYVRWRLLPRFMMSSAPLVVDPAVYPKQYSAQWTDLEAVYVTGWDGRIYSMTVRGRMADFSKNFKHMDRFAAPQFDLEDRWHRTAENKGITTTPIVMRDNVLYFTADNQRVYAMSREQDEREPYYLLAKATTPLTITYTGAANVTNSVLSSLYVGCRDNSVYCLDRLTMRKKWNYAAGVAPRGTIFADEAPTPYVYVPAEDGNIHALLVQPARQSKGQTDSPETADLAWSVPGEGTIAAGPEVVYIGRNKLGEQNTYAHVAAVQKSSGKVLWEAAAGGKDDFFKQFLAYQNAWSAGKDARLFAVTADNRIVSLKEKVRDTGVRKPWTAPADEAKVFVPKKKDGAGADGAAPAEGAPKQ